MIKIGLNGFGRIGRLVLRAALEKSDNNIEVVAINDLGSLDQNIHLLKFDSVHGTCPFSCEIKENKAYINNKEISFYKKKKTRRNTLGRA